MMSASQKSGGQPKIVALFDVEAAKVWPARLNAVEEVPVGAPSYGVVKRDCRRRHLLVGAAVAAAVCVVVAVVASVCGVYMARRHGGGGGGGDGMRSGTAVVAVADAQATLGGYVLSSFTPAASAAFCSSVADGAGVAATDVTGAERFSEWIRTPRSEFIPLILCAPIAC